MAHMIENMMFVGETPWHGLGVALEEAPSCADAIRCAGLDWTVATKALATVDGEAVAHKAVYRTDNNQILGVVGPTWKPLQNVEVFNFFDPIVQAKEAKLETAGSLDHGRRVWVLAQLSRDPSVIVKQADDVVRKYVLLSNAHDGSLAIRVGYTPIRVVCANTLAMAHDNKASALIRLHHRGNMVAALEDIRDAMNLANAKFETTAEHYRKLAASNVVNAEDLRTYVSKVFAPAKKIVDITEAADLDVIESNSRVFPKVQNLFENGRGNALPGVRGTYWAAYNAITEYVAHERGADREKRLNQTWFGAGAAISRKALSVALEMAA